MKKILITGCKGFIGSNLTRALLNNKNIEIIGLDNCSNISRSASEIKNKISNL